MNAKRVKELLAQLKVTTAELEKELSGAETPAQAEAPKSGRELAQKAVNKVEGRRAELEALSYNDLKKEAKNCGVKAVGGKDDLINAILGASGAPAETPAPAPKTGKGSKATQPAPEPEAEEEDEDESDEEEVSIEDLLEETDDATVKALAKELGIAVTAKTKVSALKKAILLIDDEDAMMEALIAVGLIDADEEEADDDSEEAGDEEETVQEQVELALKDLDDDAVKEILTDNGLSVKGKRQAWIARIVEAVEAGTITLGEEDSDDEEVDLEEMSDDELVEFAGENEVDVVYTGKGAKKKLNREATIEALQEALGEESDEEEIDFETMTDERQEACDKFETDTKKAIKAKKLKIKDIEKFLKEACGDDYDADAEEADKIELYIELNKRMIDDEGEAHDFGEPYTVNEVPACCAQALKTLDNGNLYCEVCGEEFETEE